jgi:HAD superfamily hydrolase (TIGR01509 family)
MINLRARTSWVFDMDGTLTVAIHDFAAIKCELGLAPERPILEQLAELPAAEAEAKYQRLDVIEGELARRSSPQPGARELLATLRAGGTALGVVTRNSHENALATLSTCGLSEFFQPAFVIGRDSCAAKPSADGIQMLLLLWRADAEQAVMVGDYLFDLVAGREAGAATVYVDSSGRFPYAGHADICVGNLRELLSMLEAPGQ